MLSDTTKIAFEYTRTVLFENAIEDEKPMPNLREIALANTEIKEYLSSGEDIEDKMWALNQVFAHISDSYHQGFNDDYDLSTQRSISNLIHESQELLKSLAD